MMEIKCDICKDETYIISKLGNKCVCQECRNRILAMQRCGDVNSKLEYVGNRTDKCYYCGEKSDVKLKYLNLCKRCNSIRKSLTK